MEVKTGIIVLADISGYTQFLKNYQRSMLHAELLITELIKAIMKSATLPLKVNKLEGDAVLFFGTINSEKEAKDLAINVTNQIENFFAKFKHEQSYLLASKICKCDACTQLDQLKLKIIIHTGQVVAKKIEHFDEIASLDVVIAHDLLKNSFNYPEYILMTRDFYQIAGGCTDKTPEFKAENIPDIGKIDVVYYRLASAEPLQRAEKHTLAGYYWLVKLELYRFLRICHLLPDKQFNHLPAKN